MDVLSHLSHFLSWVVISLAITFIAITFALFIKIWWEGRR